MNIKRREFLRITLAAGAAATLSSCTRLFPMAHPRAQGANETIRVAVAGIHGQGKHHLSMLQEIPNVRIVALCDPDRSLLAQHKEDLAKKNVAVDTYADIRKLLERNDIDAITIATPNHWHTLMTVWACQAGKDVYVEKPCSHNIYEGRKIVEAARKYGRVVQHGTQSRSDTTFPQLIEYIKRGNLGAIQYAYGTCFNQREGIGKVSGPQPIPPEVDYDLYQGPAPIMPLMRKRLHYDWHWVWPTGNGDIGNQGPHQMDACRWVLGQTEAAPRVISCGGRYVWDDDGTTPNVQLAIFDYKPAPLIFEVQNVYRAKGETIMNHFRGTRVGIVIQCEHGYFSGMNRGWIYDNKGKKILHIEGDGAADHIKNFIDVVRSRRMEDLHAPIREGQVSCSLVHMANISYRLGGGTQPEEIAESFQSFPVAREALEGVRELLAKNQVNLQTQPIQCGPWLDFDSKGERFTGGYRWQDANAMLARNYREPYVVPEQV